MNFKESIVRYLRDRIVERDCSFEVKKDDIFLVSYPKSGNTWVRFLIANLLTDSDVSFSNLGKFVPDIYWDKRKDIDPLIDINVFKTHSHFRSKYARNKIIYLIRDARDVAVSYYFFYNKTKRKNISFDDFLHKFLYGGIDNYGNWSENIGSWTGALIRSDNFLLVRYEDMISDPKKQMHRIVDFIGLTNVDDNKIKEAIRKSNFENLKKDEIENRKKIKELKNTDKSISFFRKGENGNWKEFFTEEQLRLLYEKFEHKMREFDYID